MTEIWKSCSSPFNKYEASSLGHIRNKISKKILRGATNRAGYIRYRLFDDDGTHKNVISHRLIFKTFNPELFDEDKTIDHIDNNPSNNHIDNLQTCSLADNSARRRPFDRTNTSKNKAVEQYTLENKYVKTFKSITEAAKAVSGKDANISRCCKGKYKYAYGYIWKYKASIIIENEIWRTITVDDFQISVSDMGRVQSVDNGRILFGSLGNDGYRSIRIRGRCYAIHRLIATAFCSKPIECDRVDHIDRNKQNNKAANLQWVTASQNSLNWRKDTNDKTNNSLSD